MTDFDTTVDKIHKRLIADIDDAMEHSGSPFNPDPTAKIEKRLAEAKASLYKAIEDQLIGEDATGAKYDGGEMIDCPACDYCVHEEAPQCACDVQNALRAQQRHLLQKHSGEQQDKKGE